MVISVIYQYIYIYLDIYIYIIYILYILYIYIIYIIYIYIDVSFLEAEGSGRQKNRPSKWTFDAWKFQDVFQSMIPMIFLLGPGRHGRWLWRLWWWSLHAVLGECRWEKLVTLEVSEYITSTLSLSNVWKDQMANVSRVHEEFDLRPKEVEIKLKDSSTRESHIQAGLARC